MRLTWILVLLLSITAVAVPGEESAAAPAAAPASAKPIALDEADVPDGLEALELRTFTPSTLYKVINGQAEMYLPYGFRLLTLTTYAPPGKPREGFDVEVYEMGSALDAYGIFSCTRSRAAEAVKVGTAGRMGTTQLSFYQGPFFIKVRSIQPRRQATALLAIARAVAKLLPPVDGDEAAVLELVRVEGVREESIVYLAGDVLSSAFFPRGLQAEVQRDSHTFTVLNIFFGSGENVRSALEDYGRLLGETQGAYGWEDTALGKVMVVREAAEKGTLFHPVGARVVAVTGPGVTVASGLSLLRELAERQSAFAARKAAGGKGEEPLELELPKPRFTGTPRDLVTPNLESLNQVKLTPVMVPPGLDNVALNKPVSSSVFAPQHGKLAQVTDGDKEALQESFIELPEGLQYLQIDLGTVHEIYAIVVWHYHLQARVYFDVVVQVAEQPDFILDMKTVFNNDHDDSAGIGLGKDKEYVDSHRGKVIDAEGSLGRYVRLYSNGNTADAFNHCIEVEVYGRPNY